MKKPIIIIMLVLVSFVLASCGGDDDAYDGYPTISGIYDREIEVGEFVTDWLIGVEASDEEDGDLTADIQLDTSEVDIYTAGEYTVTYRVANSVGNETVETITVTVIETEEEVPPTLVGVRDLTFSLSESTYDVSSHVSATDALDGDLTEAIIIDDSEVDYTEAGEYTITYTVENSLGLSTSETATIIMLYIPYQVENGGFETGDLSGWTIVSGNAFTDDAVSSQTHYWDDQPFNHVGDYHFRGIENAESAVGSLHSSPFELSGIGKISFLMGAGEDQEAIYVNIRLVETDEIIATVSHSEFDYIDGDQPFEYAENYYRYYLDLEDYIGEYLYIEIVDNDSDDSFFSFVNLDDFVTYYESDEEIPMDLTNKTFDNLTGWTIIGDYTESALLFNDDIPYVQTPNDDGIIIESHTFMVQENHKLSVVIEGSANTAFEIVDAITDDVIETIPGNMFDTFKRAIIDLSLYQGQAIYLRINDFDSEGSIKIGDITLSETLETLSHMPTQIINGSFETGDLFGWYIKGGSAFTDNVITDSTLYWQDITDKSARFNHLGTYHLYGALNDESSIGSLKSSYFEVAGEHVISMLLGAGKDSSRVMVQVKSASTNQVLATITNDDFDFTDIDSPYTYANNYKRYYLDLSAYAGHIVYLDIIDLDKDAQDFSFINIDDIVTYYEQAVILPETLTFSATNHMIEWENYIHVLYGDVVIDDSEVDMTTTGIYTLHVSITHGDDSVTNHTIEIIIEDNTPPTLFNVRDRVVMKDDTIDLLDSVYALDGFGNDVTVSIHEDDLAAFDVTRSGVYSIRYIAVAPNGLETIETAMVEVINPTNTPANADFETGDLSGWTVVSGTAFCESAITNQPTYWAEENPFNHQGSFHLRGFNCGEDSIGVLRSDYFVLDGTGTISMLIGGGNPTYEDTYIEIVDAFTGEVIDTVYNEYMNDEAYIQYYVDLSAHLGKVLYINIVDEATRNVDFAAINVDNIVTYYDAPISLDVSFDDSIDHYKGNVFNVEDYLISGANIGEAGLSVSYTGTVDIATEGIYTIDITVEYQGIVYTVSKDVHVIANPHQIINGSFETGDLTGWTVISGTAFTDSDISNVDSYWGGSFWQSPVTDTYGEYHLRGFNPEDVGRVGVMESSRFELAGSGYVSLLMGSAKHTELIYVSVMQVNPDGEDVEIHRFTNDNFSDPDYAENYNEYFADLSAYIGDTLYLRVVDEDSKVNDFQFLNLDGIITYYETVPTGEVSE